MKQLGKSWGEVGDRLLRETEAGKPLDLHEIGGPPDPTSPPGTFDYELMQAFRRGMKRTERMKGKTDTNGVILCGKVVSAKAWDPKPGGKFTNGSVTMRVGEQDIPLSVFLSITEKFDDRKGFNKTFQVGANVCITNATLSSFVKQPKTEGDRPLEVFKLEAKLNGSYQVDTDEAYTQVFVSGSVLEAKGNKAILGSAYYSGGAGEKVRELKSRRLRISLPDVDLEKMVGKHLSVAGELVANDSGPSVAGKAMAITNE